MATATWNGAVVAESDVFEMVEGNVYFPPDAIKREYFTPSAKHTHCPWKGDASYFHLEVNGATNSDAAWTYADPTPAAINIKDHVAFWGDVEVRE